MRRKAKEVNFGIVYGISPHGLSLRVGVKHAIAKEYIERFFERYKGVKIYLEKSLSDARRNKYVQTLLMRKRFVHDINSKNAHIRSQLERIAVNAPIQGTASDIIKLAMLKLQKEIVTCKLESKLILQVHDELLIESPDSEVEKISKLLKYAMEHVMILKVPLKVDIKAGKNWAELKN